LTRPFDVGPQLLVLSFRQLSRNGFSTLRIEVVEILPIDLFAFLCRGIGARDVEHPVLHEVVIGVSAIGLAPAREPDVAVCHQGADRVIRGGGGLNLLDAFLKIPGKPWLRPEKTQPEESQPQHDKRKQSPGWPQKALSHSTA